jgi:SAM-dependent methyltransferase
MKCYLCNTETEVLFNLPFDRYQEVIDNYCGRTWHKCPTCGLYQQFTYLSDNEYKNIYLKYRDKGLREITVEEYFDRIVNLPKEESENQYRWQWFNNHIQQKNTILDIGSGFGIWPYELKRNGWHIVCVEPNRESSKFINSSLQITCHNEFYSTSKYGKFDVISIVHCLEHLRDPKQVLKTFSKDLLHPNGKLFIEVPDAREFSYLPQDHDEFNSCHLFMFTPSTLCRLIELSGYGVKDLHTVHYEQRNLSRIMVIASI